MAEEDMSARYLDKSNRFYEIGMRNIKLQLKFLGTKFVVNRPDSTMENDYETFTTKLLINLNDLRDVWQRNRDSVEVYSDDGSLKVGDELQYTREGLTFRFKIVQKSSFSEAAKSLYIYVLSSIIETKDM